MLFRSDFSDFAGTGSVADLYENDLKMARDWINWYSNGKVKYEFTVNPNWIRAPKESWKYEQNAALMEALGKAEGKETGLTDAQRAEDYVQAIAKTTDLSNTASIWVYHPLGIQTIYGQMLLKPRKLVEGYGWGIGVRALKVKALSPARRRASRPRGRSSFALSAPVLRARPRAALGLHVEPSGHVCPQERPERPPEAPTLSRRALARCLD